MAKVPIKKYKILSVRGCIGLSAGKTSLEAVRNFCKLNNIVSRNTVSMGNCGTPRIQCSKRRNGMYPCGTRGKCKGYALVNTSIGNITAQEIE